MQNNPFQLKFKREYTVEELVPLLYLVDTIMVDYMYREDKEKQWELCKEKNQLDMMLWEIMCMEEIADAREDEHWGDCTGVACSCSRCHYDSLKETATKLKRMIDEARNSNNDI